MAITLSERMDSRETIYSNKSSVRFVYLARGTADNIALKTHLDSNIPGTYEGLILDEMRYRAITVDENADDGLWEIEVSYVSPEFVPLATSESSSSFDTTGSTQKVKQSIATVGAYTSSGTAPNYQGAIGVQEKKVEGADITVPQMKYTEVRPIAAGSVTNGYKGLLFSITGKVNDAFFKGFNAGELLFLGAQGRQLGGGLWTITFNFAASPNRTNFTIGGISVASKKGWEHLWVQYESAVDQNTLIQVPRAVYIEQVYLTTDFAALGIGT